MPKEMMVVYKDSRTKEHVDGDKVYTVPLIVGDRGYELYLSAATRAELDEALRPFTENEASTKIPAYILSRALGSKFAERQKPRRPALDDRDLRKAIRKWWWDNWKAAKLRQPYDRGTLPTDVVEAYHQYEGAKVPDEALRPFIENEPGKGTRTATRRPAGVDREQRKTIRTWWRQNWRAAKLPRPSDRGRIPAIVEAAYQRYDGAKVPAKRTG